MHRWSSMSAERAQTLLQAVEVYKSRHGLEIRIAPPIMFSHLNLSTWDLFNDIIFNDKIRHQIFFDLNAKHGSLHSFRLLQFKSPIDRENGSILQRFFSNTFHQLCYGIRRRKEYSFDKRKQSSELQRSYHHLLFTVCSSWLNSVRKEPLSA